MKWNGPLPPLDPVLVSRDTHACAAHGKTERASERLIVNESTGGIKDAVVHLVGKFDDGKPLSELQFPDTLNQRMCSYEPRVFVVPTGARLTMTSEDDVGHNIRMHGAMELNLAISKGGQVARRLEQPGLVKIGCDIHPWMSGFIHVVKHPYYVVSDTEGRFELHDVPAGTHDIRIWHEAWWTVDGVVAYPITSIAKVSVVPASITHVTFDFSDPSLTKPISPQSAKR